MRLLALSILVVGATTVFLIWGCIGLVRDAERMERDPRLLRRRILVFASIYIASAVYGTVEIIAGNQPPIGLVGLPVSAVFVWTMIKAACNIKSPPNT